MKTGPTSFQEDLKDREYPAEKRDLVEYAKQRGANGDVLAISKVFQTKTIPTLQVSLRTLKET